MGQNPGAHYEDRLITDIRRRLDRPVVLIGLMGAGKTRIGRALSSALGLEFVDSDHEIEKAADMKISDIFEIFGEEHFRDGEHRVIKRILRGGTRVLATGGGAPMHPETADMLWDETITIWVRADLDVLVERTSRNDKRPLLQGGNARKILSEMKEKRYPVYEKADIVIESHAGRVRNVIQDLLEKLDMYLRQSQESTGDKGIEEKD